MAYTSQEETITKSILNIKSLYNKKKKVSNVIGRAIFQLYNVIKKDLFVLKMISRILKAFTNSAIELNP